MKDHIINDFMNYATSSLAAVCSNFYLKCGAAFVYTFYAFHFDTLQTAALQAILMLVVLDMITGIFAAYKTGESIRSRKFFASAVKLSLYLIMISAAHFVEVAVPELSGFTDEAMIAFVALTEIISVIENISKAGYATPQRILETLKKLKEAK